MAQFSAVIIALTFVMSSLGLASSRAAEDVKPKPKSNKPERTLSSKERLDFIRRAQVWMPTNVAAMDLRAGPQGPGAVEAGAVVTCDYVKNHCSGSHPKFERVLPDGDVIKVKYGQDNGEVFGAVLGSRLLWALG